MSLYPFIDKSKIDSLSVHEAFFLMIFCLKLIPFLNDPLSHEILASSPALCCNYIDVRASPLSARIAHKSCDEKLPPIPSLHIHRLSVMIWYSNPSPQWFIIPLKGLFKQATYHLYKYSVRFKGMICRDMPYNRYGCRRPTMICF